MFAKRAAKDMTARYEENSKCHTAESNDKHRKAVLALVDLNAYQDIEKQKEENQNFVKEAIKRAEKGE